MNNLFIQAEYAESLSVCEKRPCGFAVQVNDEVVAIGFNHGDEEACNCNLNAENPDCLHAEIHGLKHTVFLSNDDVVAACTYLCCLNCCKEMLRRGIRKLYYRDHRNIESKQQGIRYLRMNGVEVFHFWNGKERNLDEV